MNKTNARQVKKQPKLAKKATHKVSKRHSSIKKSSSSPVDIFKRPLKTTAASATTPTNASSKQLPTLPLQQLTKPKFPQLANNRVNAPIITKSKMLLHHGKSHLDPSMNNMSSTKNNDNKNATSSTNNNNNNDSNNAKNSPNWHSTTRTISSSYRFNGKGDDSNGIFQIVSGESVNNNPMTYTVKRGELHFDKTNGHMAPKLTESFKTTDVSRLNAALPLSTQYDENNNNQRQLGTSDVNISPTLSSNSLNNDLSDVNTIQLRAARADASPPLRALDDVDFDPVKEMESMIRSHNKLFKTNFNELHRQSNGNFSDMYKSVWHD